MGYFPGMSLRWGPPDGRFWNPPVQTLSPDELRRLQLERLGHALERIWTRPIPFFRRKLEAAHLTPADIRAQVDDAVEVWRRVRPAEVRLFGNAAAKFSEGARRRGLDPARDLGLTVAGEDPRAQYRTVSAGLEALGMLGTACAEADGAHVCEDLAIVEILDRRTRRPVGDGERGVLVITTLEKDNLMLRYDLEDVVRTNYRPCPCGETHVRLFWEGRAKDIVPVAGRE